MKKSLILTLALTLGVAGSAFAANPFSDVPTNSWAYAAVEKLAAEGVIDGMGNGKFEGNRNMTRYEMAQIIAKAMAKGVKRPELQKLANEFSDELKSMGVRVAKLESGLQISGEFRMRYRAVERAGDIASPVKDDFAFRTRLHLRSKINKNWDAYMMLENIQKMDTNSAGTDAESTVSMRRAMAVGKYDRLQVQVGRIPYSDKDKMLFNPLEMDGLTLNYNFGAVKATALYGRFQPLNGNYMKKDANVRIDSLGVALDWQVSKAFELTGAFYNHKQKVGYEIADGKAKNTNVYDVLATYKIKDWKFSAMYIGSNQEMIAGSSKNGYSFRIAYGNFKPSEKGSYLLQANYFKIPVAAYYGSPYQLEDLTESNKGAHGYSLIADYAVAKNVRLHAAYLDVKGVTAVTSKSKIYSFYTAFYF